MLKFVREAMLNQRKTFCASRTSSNRQQGQARKSALPCAALLLLASVVSLPKGAAASNPIIPTAYSADPSAHVFAGRIYVYASHDRDNAREFDMLDYNVDSSDDLQNWQDHGIAFRLSDTRWAKSHLWAPDCAFKDGRYFLYYPAQDAAGKFHIGVAIGDSPSGPFVNIGNPIAGASGIDPSLFLDEDGQGYLIWQDHGPVIARMKPNLIELAEAPHKVESADNFFEGPWIFKRNQLYYLTYPAFKPGGTGRGCQGQNYDYAISGKPTGPYVYKGAFAQSGPGGDNIHGSQLEWNGKWYCFYHAFSTSVGRPGHGYTHAVKMDELRFADNGSILPLQWTTEGPSEQKPLDALSRLEAETLNSTDIPEGDHAIAIDGGSRGPVYLGPATAGSWVKYAQIDFGSGASQFQARVASATGGGVIDLHLDRIDGPLVGSCTVRYTGGWQQ